MSPDTRAQRAYQLYVVEGMALDDVCAKLHARRDKIRRWISERGGVIRGRNTRGAKKTQVGPAQTGWRKAAKCSIGYAKPGTHSLGESWYCAGHCEHGRCDQEATGQNLKAFAELQERRVAEERLVKERKARRRQRAAEEAEDGRARARRRRGER